MRISRSTITFAIVALALTLAIACGRGGGPSQEARTLTAADILTRSGESLDRTNSFHFLLEHENGSTPIVFDLLMERADGDIVRPDRLQADVVAKLRGVTARSRVIAVGDRTWISNPFNQTMQQLPAGTSVRQIFDPGVGVGRILNSIREPRLSGEERADGVEAYIIEGTIDSGDLRSVAPIAEAGQSVRVRLLIGKSDFLPRFIRLEGPLATNEPAAIARKVTLSKFNEQISIEPPQ